jgi:tryptophanyl-tRNA synthetase
MTRRLSGFQPTGHLQLGNYLGAIRPMVDSQHDVDSVVAVVDLHALTVTHDPARVRELTMEVATLLLAAGVDPEVSLLYVQSHVPEHTELHYLLECVTGYGEAHRMIQFKEKSGAHTRLSLLTYPVLMAADILLHGADEVPVGEDQAQHLELAREVAARFNHRYGPTFAPPRTVTPPVAARVMDLADPTAKMGKSNASSAGVIGLLDPPEVVRRKVMRAVTDPGSQVRYDPAGQPGVSNLLEIIAACGRGTPAGLSFDSYRSLKAAAVDAVVEALRPIQARYAALAADPGYVHSVLAAGARRARERGATTVRRAKEAIGLLPGIGIDAPGTGTRAGHPATSPGLTLPGRPPRKEMAS